MLVWYIDETNQEVSTRMGINPCSGPGISLIPGPIQGLILDWVLPSKLFKIYYTFNHFALNSDIFLQECLNLIGWQVLSPLSVITVWLSHSLSQACLKTLRYNNIEYLPAVGWEAGLLIEVAPGLTARVHTTVGHRVQRVVATEEQSVTKSKLVSSVYLR